MMALQLKIPVHFLLKDLIRFRKTSFGFSRYCTRTEDKKISDEKSKEYKSTVLLPQTKFPKKLSGSKRIEMDNYLLEKCGFLELYKWQRENLSGPDFVLHDGPPYANGEPHMGHAVNKILKDITLRSHVIRGQRVHYVPGWDCHGLPIESKVLAGRKDDPEPLTPIQLRKLARTYSHNELEKQRQAFISWGVMADWNDSGCYFTNDISYMTNQWRQFIKLYEKKLIFRDFKPVYWSPSSRTALAESELEYNENHKSKCATVRLLLTKLPEKLRKFENRVIYALTWTTTPWTLVANQALAYASNISYCVAEDQSGTLYIVAEKLLSEIAEKIGVLKPIFTFLGDDLMGSEYSHPISKESLPFLPSNHVTDKIGTGLVHTAPAHGNEDFLVCLNHNLPVKSLVGEDGCFTAEAGSNFSGLEVLKEGTEKALQHIGENVLHTEIISHSYPYDWRTKKPVITRASHQWFLNTEALKEKAIDSLDSIKFHPKSKDKASLNYLIQQLSTRPFWCISRQRSWGTPIPVFYDKMNNDEVITSSEIVENLCGLLERHGADCWWTLPVDKLLNKHDSSKSHQEPGEIERGLDIMDIWFDSGISWSSVLPEKRADLYLEGMDQFNGWFYSSLITSIALQEKPPFSSIFVHGFTVDKNGQKMSKSLGNIVKPEEIIQGKKGSNSARGIDVLRWWVAAHGVQHSQIQIVDTVIEDSADSVHKIRSVLRFLLGALHPYDMDNNNNNPEYSVLDRYMLHRLYHFYKMIEKFYDDYEYHHISKAILNFVANDISGLYCSLIKDRLYCEEANSPSRLAALTVLDSILTILTRSLAPILPHLAEEVWLYYPENLTSVPLHHSTPVVPSEEWNSMEIEEIMSTALSIRRNINKIINTNTSKFTATIRVYDTAFSHLRRLQSDEISTTSELANILQVSSVTLLADSSCTSPVVDVKPIEYSLCKRCKKYPESAKEEPCIRCKSVLNLSSIS